jgi:hypothetical protein
MWRLYNEIAKERLVLHSKVGTRSKEGWREIHRDRFRREKNQRKGVIIDEFQAVFDRVFE